MDYGKLLNEERDLIADKRSPTSKRMNPKLKQYCLISNEGNLTKRPRTMLHLLSKDNKIDKNYSQHQRRKANASNKKNDYITDLYSYQIYSN